MLKIEQYNTKYINDAIEIWNDIVEDGVAFPQTELLNSQTGDEFFKSQSFTGIAIDADSGEVVGLYISTRTMSGAAGIFRMRAMRSRRTSAASISAKFS